MTSYDKELATKLMDKNHDGKCDICGMSAEMCISSGQLQCNMGSQKTTMGILGSQHIHADWRIYINGIKLDLSDKSHMDRMKKNMSVSSFIHVDSGSPQPEKTGDVLHMHATGIPLWVFFDSIEMKFNKTCIMLDNTDSFCSDNKSVPKFYVNRKLNNEYENYIFKDLDKILISYSNETNLNQQLNSITDFAKNH
ncbi:MAG: hypothetical protein J4428_03330 [Candidatus Aenigmarchaeota archaeon]|nr:hypothetical protein [Candidatus Aenigmarchaeota archaeon]